MKNYLWFILISLFCSCKEETKKEYYNDGKIKKETRKIDEFTQEVKTYYVTGSIMEKYFCLFSKVNGNYIKFDKNGQIQSQGFFDNGIAIGPTYYYFENSLILYNERDFKGEIYYVKKYDTLTHNLIKEEGICISPNILKTKSDSLKRMQITFFYAQPDGYSNTLLVTVNNIPISIDTIKGHQGIITVSTGEKNKVNIYSSLKDRSKLVCKDSLSFTTN